MKWYFALCQHPMYMIIEHDETAAERTPPWGEPNIDTYIERIRRNAAALDRYPHLKFNYDFSGAELEDLAERAPDVVEILKDYIAQGRVGFVNGNYAQAHLHTFGPESNIRQMQEGVAAIERIVGVRVTSYAHQEPAIHDQMPQILRALGYRFAVTPGFFWVMQFLTPHEILGVQYQGLRFLQDEEFTHWQGLDGSLIPLYLSQPRIRPKGSVHGAESHKLAVRQELVKDLLHYPPIRCDFPDMVDIDDDWVDDHSGHEFVVLDEQLAARLAETPPRSRARLYTYWGSGEGVEAEILHRANHRAEAALLEAESLGALAQALTSARPADVHEGWRQLLRAQHHDAYWVGGMGLRRKALGWIAKAQALAGQATVSATNAIASRIDTRLSNEGTPFVVWEPWPLARKDVFPVTLSVPTTHVAGLQVRNARGQVLPSQVLATADGGDGKTAVQMLIQGETNGLGYQVLEAVPGPAQSATGGHQTFANPFYSAVIEADGTFSSLRTVKGDHELVKAQAYRGNMLRAQTQDGQWLDFVSKGQPVVHSGPLCRTITVRGVLGDSDVEVQITLYHGLPRIDITLTFEFHDALIGNFWEDETKLNVYWPVAPEGSIEHDIPFGAIQGREERSFFATTWVRLGSQRAGLAVFHRGTNRFWVRRNVLANVLACGVQGNDIGTRAVPFLYIKDYDLRLRGRHVISYAVYPHEGSWQDAAVHRQAFWYTYPLQASQVVPHPGDLPPELSLLCLEHEGLVPTAVFARDEDLVCRLFETMGRAARPLAHCRAPWAIRQVTSLAGDPLGSIGPFTIAEMTLGR